MMLEGGGSLKDGKAVKRNLSPPPPSLENVLGREGGSESVPANQVPNSCNHSCVPFILNVGVCLCVVEEPSDSLSAHAKGGGTNERTEKKRVGVL